MIQNGNFFMINLMFFFIIIDTLSISDKDKHYQIENNINMSNGEVDSTALIM
jgi:hypothetical protein